MIRKVTIKGFKRFQEIEFNLPGHIVLAGPNNMGKTTVLQAVAAWDLAFNRWREINAFHRRFGRYTSAPIARQAFHAVPLRTFELLWRHRDYRGSIEIGIQTDGRPNVTMELMADSSEQVNVRPRPDVPPDILRDLELGAVFIPPMTGVSTDEPVYQPAKIQQLLGMCRPGEVLRNLLVEANSSEDAWQNLLESVRTMFGYEVLPPDALGADIIAEYQMPGNDARYDIASAGSGFQQVLMLLAFLNTRPASILLLDEPDAHLHLILQDAIYGELRATAARQRSQLIIATHSEVLIDSVDPMELMIMLEQPRPLADNAEKRVLVRSLGALSNTDIMLAREAPGILYTEDYTDLDILREWAQILRHPIHRFLSSQVFWKKTVFQPRDGAAGISWQEHYNALRLVRDDLPGLVLVDGDARGDIPPTDITGEGLQKLRWRRYEIESYLVHPAALARYVEQEVGEDAARPHIEDLMAHLQSKYPPDFLKDPLEDLPFLVGTKARTDLLPPALDVAGLAGIPYTRYYEIARVMSPDEIHPEVTEKLDLIHKAFNL